MACKSHEQERAMPSPFDFTGKSVFVAGGTSGINLGIADAYAAAGANVAVMSRSPERVAAAAERLARHGRQSLGLVGDVRNMDVVVRNVAAAHQAFGDIDVLVSGAAGNFLAAALNLSSNGFKAVVDIDLVGTFHVLRASFDYLRRPGASIINISAPQSVSPTPLQAHVCAAKAGLDQVMRVLALEWGQYGVRVNSIMPGPIEGTVGVQKLVPPSERPNVEARIPLRRFGTLDDVAQMALFLGSAYASYVTGALIPVDGGISLLGGRNYAGEPQLTERAALPGWRPDP
jgi:NAD(P)-dependent dehydrogenase (short-subunit alcohol dehydrogenase family)